MLREKLNMGNEALIHDREEVTDNLVQIERKFKIDTKKYSRWILISVVGKKFSEKKMLLFLYNDLASRKIYIIASWIWLVHFKLRWLNSCRIPCPDYCQKI